MSCCCSLSLYKGSRPHNIRFVPRMKQRATHTHTDKTLTSTKKSVWPFSKQYIAIACCFEMVFQMEMEDIPHTFCTVASRIHTTYIRTFALCLWMWICSHSAYMFCRVCRQIYACVSVLCAQTNTLHCEISFSGRHKHKHLPYIHNTYRCICAQCVQSM